MEEGHFGVCDSDGCGCAWSHLIHILGCKERPRFQLPGTLFVWSYTGPNCLCFDSGFFPLGKISVMIYGCLASIIFCGYIVYDTDNLIKRYSYDEYIWAAVSLYLDIINLFLALLTVFRAADS
ncbi:Bax inhibitor-1 family protein [Prunus dulcis]|uniref:Bax inhibitor-1 family protein n=1 Tax=Prunus dulcis TaxID=3755 RepID=A0A4Y1S0N3_PRUDU|nr:Bax inhibitor-1 family protein [Prunus dulcis]